jgi:hypothetical protein
MFYQDSLLGIILDLQDDEELFNELVGKIENVFCAFISIIFIFLISQLLIIGSLLSVVLFDYYENYK